MLLSDGTEPEPSYCHPQNPARGESIASIIEALCFYYRSARIVGPTLDVDGGVRTMSRIEPLTEPYAPEVERALKRWMPPGVDHEPLSLFRTLHRNPELASRMFVLGAGLLGHGLLPDIDREVVIARATARAECSYEWGVHVTAFWQSLGLTEEQLLATTKDRAAEAADWSPRLGALLDAVDELHDTAGISDKAWSALRQYYDDAQLLELLVLAGWYRTISQVANGLLLNDEPWAAHLPANSRSLDS
ncbi:carboxymuconolactone decarboxylase family protein [Kribbella sp. NPDC051586]|uniref:carboxymuconolactone decarboxylase family protein n=1 Tax=Kribbella sp. NPDC051586 TaxID=3364118 RepID=UPI0037A5D821